MDANTLATEVAPIIIQLPPKAVWTATAAVVVAVLAVIANIWVSHRTLKHQKENEEKKQKHDLLMAEKKLLTEKYEQITILINEISYWSDDLYLYIEKTVNTDNEMIIEKSNINVAKSIANLYFPELAPGISKISIIHRRLYSIFYDCEGRIAAPVSMNKSEKPTYEYEKRWNIFNETRANESELFENLLKTINENAHKYRFTQS